MSRYLLDTNIIVALVRDADLSSVIDRQTGILGSDTTSLISVVSLGELWSLAYQFQWGDNKRRRLREILDRFAPLDLTERIINRYAQIGAYSQGKLVGRPLPDGMSARNMGKNDLWIAATACVTDATLVTIDRDFDHLAGEFLRVIFIDPVPP